MSKAKVISIGDGPNVPRSKCPHCQKVMIVDVILFKDDAAKIMQSKCPYCGGTIFTGLLILSHPDLHGLGKCIEIVVDALNPGSKLLT